MASKALVTTKATDHRSNPGSGIWQAKFLKSLASTRNIAKACRTAGVDRSNVYAELKRNPQFRQAVDDLNEAKADMLQVRLEDIALGTDSKSLDAVKFALQGYRKSIFGDSSTQIARLEGELQQVREELTAVMEAFAQLPPEHQKAVRESVHELLGTRGE
jgi:hypothetical protein